jgi:hypothetical protein
MHSLLATNYVHIMLGANALLKFVPACARPARLHSLHPAGVLEFDSSHSVHKQDTLGQEQISLLLCLPLPASPVAASSSAAAEPLAAQDVWVP